MFRRPMRALLLLLVLSSAGCGGLEDAASPLAPLSTAGLDIAPEPATENRYALVFTGRHSRVDVPYSSDYKTPRFTVELWVYVESLRPFTPLLASTSTNEWNTADGYSLKFESDKVYLRAAKASNLAIGYSAPFIPPLRRWTHLAGTYDGAVGRVYVDGQLLIEKVDAVPIWYGMRGLVFGAGYHSLWGGESHFQGRMDEIRIWDHARTKVAIQKTMNQELFGNEEGLVGYWNFETPRTTLVEDASSNDNHGLLSGGVGYIAATPF